MPSSTPSDPHAIWFIFFFSLFPLSLSDGRTFLASLDCGSNRAPSGSTFITGFVQEMEHLSQLVNNSHWGVHSVNSTPAIFGLAQCFKDLTQIDCLLCFASCRTRLPRCLPAMSARIYLDGCFVRYDNYSFFAEAVDPTKDRANCSDRLGSVRGLSAGAEFAARTRRVVNAVVAAAVAGGGFGVSEEKAAVDSVYAMAQCWGSVSRNGCRECLETAGTAVGRCLPAREARGLNVGCYLRYSTEKFYNLDKASGGGGSISSGVAIAIVFVAAAILALSLSAAYAIYVKYSKARKERNSLSRIPTAVKISSLNFRYEVLEKATDYFNHSKRLGQGGAGSVYMGILPNGKTVAVKRLIFNTRQWVDDFFNEVNLISGIQHKNLVKLLGCSIEGPESLLVYEYVPNKSLDHFISDKDKLQTLSWRHRFNIIAGTAEGLAYLHGGSEVRIIHRDIKSSNVLLDEDLSPKIADFGLARCFAADKTHLSTGIAGTLGYMAPEYLVRGQLTEKADVYSFGVLVLEVVCGRKNNVFVQGSGSLLQTVWRNYKLNSMLENVDPCLGGDLPAKEASDVFQIALLCTQASPALRPSMDEVVRMLTDRDCEIPIPCQPPFLNASALDPTSSSRSFSTSSLGSNAPMKIELSYTSTENSSIHSTNGRPRNVV